MMEAAQKQYRVALLLPRFSRYGGVEQFGYRLAVALVQRGCAVDFICARQEEAAPQGVRVLCAGRPRWGKAAKLFWFVWRAERLRKQGKYDLVISLGKSWRQDVTRMGGGPLRLFWEMSERSLPAGWPRWRKKLARVLSPANWMILGIERHQFTQESRVIAVSHLVKEWLLQAHPALEPEKVSVVYNKPDLTRFFSADEQERKSCREWLSERTGDAEKVAADAVYIGTASTNFVLKGVAPLIQALAQLPERCHLFVAGGRDAAKYKKLATSLCIQHRVHFCGRVNDMPRFYRALDVFILPTFYDACSNAVLEALASGCKTITSKANGAAYFLPAEQVLQDPGSVPELTELLTRQIEAPSPGVFVWPEKEPSGVDAFADAVLQEINGV